MFDESLIDKVRKNICQYSLFEHGAHIVTGVSGGADSVCLLSLLTALRGSFNIRVTAVHVNHLLRGAESEEDEEFVGKLCRDLDVPLKIFHEDIRKASETLGISLEEAGREARYSCFERTLGEVCGNAVAVAHNFEDQAETVMMNILRGCGIEGLSGMDFKNGAVIRPLLNVRRSEILNYLSKRNIPYRTDSSNLSGDYARNRVRNILFPMIKEQLAADPADMLNRLSCLSRRDDAYLESQAHREFNEVFKEEDGIVTLDASDTADLDPALSSRMIRLAWEKVTGARKALESNHIDKIIMLCKGNATGKSVSLPGGISAWTAYRRLMIGQREKPDKKLYSYEVQIPGEILVPEAGGVLRARLLDRNGFAREAGMFDRIRENSKTQIFDYLKINCGINIRNRREGDRIRPHRSNGGKKLKEFFIDKKIRAELRDTIPLVASGSDILWVIGMRTSDGAKPDERTEKYLILEWNDK